MKFFNPSALLLRLLAPVVLLLLVTACGAPVQEVRVQNTTYIDTPYQSQVAPETVAEIQSRYPDTSFRADSTAPNLGRLKVTVREFEIHPSNPDTGRTISDIFTTIFTRDPVFEVVERERLAPVVQEIELQQSGLVETQTDPTDTMVGAVEYLISGSASQIGNTWRIDARVTDATKGRLLFAETTNAAALDARSSEMLARRVAGRMKSLLSATVQPVHQSSPSPPLPHPAGEPLITPMSP
jgi:curli biogenesis system outer membrane secretion channel CsgG